MNETKRVCANNKVMVLFCEVPLCVTSSDAVSLRRETIDCFVVCELIDSLFGPLVIEYMLKKN